MVTANRRFYYTGDTGFCDREFRKIGDRLGPFDLAAIPIGAYSPRYARIRFQFANGKSKIQFPYLRWFMKSQHVDPHEAVKIHELVKSNFSMGIHWGTYHMGSYEVSTLEIFCPQKILCVIISYSGIL